MGRRLTERPRGRAPTRRQLATQCLGNTAARPDYKDGEWGRSERDIRDGKVISAHKIFRKKDFTESVINEYIDAMENARMLPVRTEPLLDIICEEAAYYFDGSKSVEETAKVTRNRVQMYLDEHK